MEERIKKIKVTSESLDTVATFTRDSDRVDGLKRVTKYWTWTEKSLFKKKEMKQPYKAWVYVDPETGKEYEAAFRHAKNSNIYDVEVNFNGISRFLTPVLLKDEDTLESVNKITINLTTKDGKEEKYRLYFTKDESDIWNRNLDAIANLLNESKSIIWIEYSV